MKKLMLVISFFIFLISYNNTYAQDEIEFKKKLGLGVSLFNYTELEMNSDRFVYSPTSIFLALDLSKRIRIEPTFGIVSGDVSSDYNAGLGTFYMNRKEKFNLMYGFRFNYTSNEDKIFSPTVGGEFYFIPHFSLSGEVNLMMVNRTNYLTNKESNLIFTNSRVVVRFYFGK